MTRNNFNGWDFDNIWDINNGTAYPYLRSLAQDVIGKITSITTIITPNSITLNWESIDGATGYEIEVDGVVIDNGNNTSYIHDGLEIHTEHEYRIRAKDESGLGQWSSLITAKTDMIIYPPENIQVSRTENSITITWDEVNFAAGYEIEVDGVIIDNGNSKTYEHIGLSSGSEHTYRVRGIDDIRKGMWSEVIGVSTISMTLQTPMNITTQKTETSIILTWDSVDRASVYEIEVNGLVIDNGNSTSYEHRRVELGLQNVYRIRARNTDELSPWSNTIMETIERIAMNGLGTIDSPYIITKYYHLEEVNQNLSSHYKLGNNIDLENMEQIPIEDSIDRFTGSFDGNGYAITNLRIAKPEVDIVGLFAYIDGAVIKNLTIENVDIEGKAYVGTLVGEALNSFQIDNCIVKGTGKVKGTSYIGGLVGRSSNGEIKNSSVQINVEGSANFVGGLGGYTDRVQVRRCWTSGELTSIGSQVGGLIGFAMTNTASSNIAESYSLARVSGENKVGGLIGEGYSYGPNVITVENSFALGNVTSGDNINYGYAGGLIGYCRGGSSNNRNTLKNSYYGGKVNSNTDNYTGGLAGHVNHGSLVNCYYDGVMCSNIAINGHGISKLTTAMKAQNTFIDWDFGSVWNIEEGSSYPYLKNLPKPLEVSEGLPENEVAGGKGIIDNPYIIETREQLNNMRFQIDAHYKLRNDIDLENIEWSPILEFTGSLDGAGYTIRNLRMTRPTEDGLGLFKYINGGVIKNLTIENVDIEGKTYVGTLVGEAFNSFQIDNCIVKGTGKVKGTSYIGGLVGRSSNGEIKNSSVQINVEGSANFVGGLGGYTDRVQVRRCWTSGELTSIGSQVGGLIGFAMTNTASSNIAESYSLARVSGESKVGGLIGAGYSYNSNIITVENCFALGTVSSSNIYTGYVGGLIGHLYGSSHYKNIMKNNYSGAKVNSSTDQYVGGLTGHVEYGSIESCYYDAIASGCKPTYGNISKLTTAMKAQDTFIDWDFGSVWNIEEGSSYPYLKNMPRPLEVSEGLPQNDIGGGKGTVQNPYIIETRQQLDNMRFEVNSHYKLGNDIDLENIGWNSIVEFTGSLDGAGYTIRNLRIAQPEVDRVGLFGYAKGAVIKNLTIENVDIEGKNYVGVLVGDGLNSFQIDNCIVKGIGKVKGTSYIGGLIGRSSNGEISNSSVQIDVEGSASFVGGLGGYTDRVQVRRCWTSGDVTSTGSKVGGLIGLTKASTVSGSVTESYSLGKVLGEEEVGGLIGVTSVYSSNIITVENCFALGDVTSNSIYDGYAGGLIGHLAGSSDYLNVIKNSYSGGKVNSSSNRYIAGFIGRVIGSVISCYYDGIVCKDVPMDTRAVSKLTTAMKSQLTFIDWDFDNVWDIEEGSSYPYLKNIPKPLEVSEGLPENDVAGGKGTVDEPYIIETRQQLDNMRCEISAHYKLGRDIDLENIGWKPIGSNSFSFKGNLDGNGHTIKNLKITQIDVDRAGLFSHIYGSAIKNLTIENVDIEGKSYVGALVGYASHSFLIDNCTVQGTGKVKGISHIGGLVGGSIGINNIDGKISNSSGKINVEGSQSMVGGLAGHVEKTQVSNCYAVGDVTGTDSEVGGLVGVVNMRSSITQSYSLGKAVGKSKVGGLIGAGYSSDSGGITVEDCFALGDLTSNDINQAYIGGLIGLLTGTSGYNNTIKNSYSAGKINRSTDNYSGGLVGYLVGKAESCYYDGVVCKDVPMNGRGISKLTSAMKAQIIFTDWDFENIWTIDERKSYPYLKTLPKPLEVASGLPIDEIADGIGTADEPYIIKARNHLNNMRYDLSSYYRLRNDIDLGDIEWTPIGQITNDAFKGSLEADGYTIKNLRVSRADKDYVGLFGYIYGAVIRNLNIENVDIEGKDYVGALVGQALNDFDIENCTVEGLGRIKGDNYIGGLVGSSRGINSINGRIDNSSVKINVEGSGNMLGGLGGYVEKTQVGRCYAVGDVTGIGSEIGGLIGEAKLGVNLTQSYSLGNVAGKNKLGGLIGAGYSGDSGRITVEDCFALGGVTSSDMEEAYIGGLMGLLSGDSVYDNTIKNSYSAGKINRSTENYVGGLIGHIIGKPENCYYDGIASGCEPNTKNISRLTTAMKSQYTFIDWDFDNIWDIEERSSYPYLRSLPKPLKVSEGLPENEVAGGEGAVQEPYIVKTREQLNNMRFELDAHYILGNDIDLENIEWTSIVEFTGSLDGDGYTIKNLKIVQPEVDKVGLFGYVKGAVVKDLTIENVDIEGRNYVGALVGDGLNSVHIDNCIVKGLGKVKGSSYVGGLVGRSSNSKISNSSGKIDVEGSENMVGGLAGYTDRTQVRRCYTLGDVTATGSQVGGLIGFAMTNSASTGITESYSTGNVSGKNKVGGLIGEGCNFDWNTITVENCFALGDVTARDDINYEYAGGLIGYSHGGFSFKNTVKNSYSAGRVNSNTDNYTGGLTGHVNHGEIISCYYDSTITGFTTPLEQAKTQQELMEGDTFIDWDFIDVWDIDEGSSYPFLRALPVPKHEKMLDHLMPVKLRIIRKSDTEIVLRWDGVPEADYYEIMVNGVVINNGADTTYVHDNLLPGTTHEYRIRAKNTQLASSWSPRLFVTTLLGIPQNVRATLMDDTISVTWDAVEGITQYIVEVNGEETYTLNTTSYIHENIEENKAYYYRVRAIDGEKTSEWSEVVSVINWPKNKPAICLAVANWKSYIDENDELEVIVKANGFKDFYTMQLYLEYDSNRVTPDLGKIKSLIELNEENKYFSTLNDKVFKMLLSATGDIKGKEGEFDLASIKIELDAYRETSIEVDILKLVNSMASYIDIAQTLPLKIKQLAKIEY